MSAASANTSAAIASTIGTARGTTHGSWRPFAFSVTESPRKFTGKRNEKRLSKKQQQQQQQSTRENQIQKGNRNDTSTSNVRREKEIGNGQQEIANYHGHMQKQGYKREGGGLDFEKRYNYLLTSFLRQSDGSRRLEGDPEHNLLAVADAALDASAEVCRCAQFLEGKRKIQCKNISRGNEKNVKEISLFFLLFRSSL